MAQEKLKVLRIAKDIIKSICMRYGVSTKEKLYEAIKLKRIASHPACEDHISWKNMAKYLTGV